jgi:DNA anti-recombination protein RmuC
VVDDEQVSPGMTDRQKAIFQELAASGSRETANALAQIKQMLHDVQISMIRRLESENKIVVDQISEAAASIMNALATITEALASINNAINTMVEKMGEIIRIVEDGLKYFTQACNTILQNDVMLERRLRALEMQIFNPAAHLPADDKARSDFGGGSGR